MEVIHETQIEKIKKSLPGEVIIVERSRGNFYGYDYKEIRVNFRDCNKTAEFRVFYITENEGIQLPLRI